MQMQKIINRILEGNFDCERGSLDFSCSKIELSVRKGELYEGSFRIRAGQGIYTEGTVLSSDLRMECLTEEFSGSTEVLFRFHGEHLEEGDVVRGNFEIISNQGEYYIPFAVSVEYVMPEASVGSVKNLFHFANLAKSSWKEAVNLFYSPEFARIFSGSDAAYAEDYRALSARAGHEQSVEEFLIQVNKKQKTEFLVREAELSVEAPRPDSAHTVAEGELTIVRNGWGYTKLDVECEGGFLYTEKETLTDDDFLGNHCRLPVYIDGSRCHAGKNFGCVRLRNPYVELCVPVTALTESGNVRKARVEAEAERKKCTEELMKFYLAFRMRKIGTSVWLKETGRLLERLVAMDENEISVRLFQAQLLITEERYNEAGWILDHVAELFVKQPPENALSAYYLYLNTLIHGDAAYVAGTAAEVEQIYRRDLTDWRVAWLLLYLSRDYRKSDRKKWELLESLFDSGCTSPVLYVEAVAAANANPALLRRPGGFELQVFWYGAKHGILKREVTEQVIWIAGRVKEYSPVLFRTLKTLYGKKKDVRLLQEICSLLIKGAKTGTEYFDWYRAGVEAGLRITNLYEYYMMSINPDRVPELPKAVLMYFSYRNNMDYVRSACLYDYILQNAGKLGELGESFRPRMEYFVTEQIKREHIDRHLAAIYNKLLRRDMVNEQTAPPLSKLLFAHLLQAEDAGMQKVYVYQEGNLCPMEYTLSEGRTWISLYGSRYTIVFEDAAKNRFIKNVEYTLEKLMIPGKFLRWVLPFTEGSTELNLYLCDSESVCREEAADRVRRELRIAASDRVEPKVKKMLYLRILQYYYDTDDMPALDAWLTRIPAQELNAEERAEVIRFMVLRGSVGPAEKLVRDYGPYFVEVKVLIRLICALLEKYGMEEDPLLVASSSYVFQKGKYDERILEYLILHYRGMIRNMRNIWKAARSFDLECGGLDERMLLQMLYSGAFVGERSEIFRHYVSRGPKPEVEEAFLAQCAYDCFVGDRVMDKTVFSEIGSMYRRGEPVRKICKLAWLKYFAENREETDEESRAVSAGFLKEMSEEGIYLEFFRKFGEYPDMQRELADKMIVEYHADPGCRVCIHYSILHEDGESAGYRSEYMKEAFKGVFFRDFVLFFGESLQYYITEERDGEEQLTESGTLQKGDDGGWEEESRYRLINDITISKSLQDYDTMDDLLEEYYRKDFLNGRLFVLK